MNLSDSHDQNSWCSYSHGCATGIEYGCGSVLAMAPAVVVAGILSSLVTIETIQRKMYKQQLARTKFETIFFEAEWRKILFQTKVFGAAMDSVKNSSELSSQFFGRLKFLVLFEY